MTKPYPRLTFELLESRQLLAANPIITEFMADNKGALVDGYGVEQDWVELFNAGDESVNLAGYGLTDNANNLHKWTFPSITLAPGQYLVVYASGRNEVDQAGHVHTSFSLSDEGEYLGLSTPLGVVLSEIGTSTTDFPPQDANASYGLAFASSTTEAITASSPSKYLVPVDGTVDATWMLPSFDAAAWTTGTARLGYEAAPGPYASLIQTTLPVSAQSAYVRIPFTVSDPAAVIGTLRMRYDDGFVAYLNGVEIARKSAPDTLAFDSAATEFRPQEAAIVDQIINVSAHSGALQLGENILAIHVLNSAQSPTQDLLLAPSLALSTGALITPHGVGGMMAPTPGAPNTNIVASDVAFSRVGGAFAGPFELTLSSPGVGEVIRYTTDGTNPTASSPIYSDPIAISASVHIRARAFGLNGEVGKVHAEAFSRVAAGVAGFTSDLPIVVLENFGAGLPDREFEDAMFSLYETNGVEGRSALTDQPTLTSPVGQHRRGSSTYNQPKPNLRIEFHNEAGEDRSVELLGMPSEADWVLYAPHHTDRSMLRNVVMYDLSGQAVEYAVRTRYVEVFSNMDGGDLDADDYLGVYVLTENIKRDGNRVDIDELTPADVSEPDITGGYIIKIDRPEAEEDSSWNHTGSNAFVHVEPDRAEMTQAQVDYIRGYLNDFSVALAGPNWTDPEVGYAAYLDVDSYIDHHILRAFSREPDTHAFSEYIYKPRGGKLTYGPAWDFDRSAGSEGGFQQGAEGWAVTVGGTELRIFRAGWANRLFADPDFIQQWIDRWHELRDTAYADAALSATVSGHGAEIEESQARNTARWPSVAPNGGAYADPGLVGFEAEVSHLANWLLARAAWIDQQMVAAPTIEPDAEGFPSDGLVTLLSNHSSGVLYYTLDGSDPRAEGGGISPAAILYTGPITITPGTRVSARAYSTTGFAAPFTSWSAMESEVFVDKSPLRIVEIHYNPTAGDTHEFIELMNTGTTPISLDGVQITDFHATPYTFASGQTLAAGQRIVVARNPVEFAAHYGNGVNVAVGGFASAALSNGGETISLRAGGGELIQSFTYDDGAGWPTSPDGGGFSLEYIGLFDAGEDPAAGPGADPFDNPANWRASAALGGSPGAGDVEVPADSADFNGDDIVDGSDFMIWQRGFGQLDASHSMGDADHDEDVDADDLAIWKSQFGQAPPAFLAARVEDSPAATFAVEALALHIAADDPSASLDWPASEVRFEAVLNEPAATTPTVAKTTGVEVAALKATGNYWIDSLTLQTAVDRRQSTRRESIATTPDAQSADEALARWALWGATGAVEFDEFATSRQATEDSSESDDLWVDEHARALQPGLRPALIEGF